MNKIPYIEKYGNNKFYGGHYYDVLKRDKYCCMSCGSDINLNVHHIIGLRLNSKESYDISSMVTLCRRCHSKEHNHPRQIVTKKLLNKIGFNSKLEDNILEISNNTGNRKINEVYRYG